MKQLSYQNLKKNLSRSLDEAAAGQQIVVTRRRKPVARLTAVEPTLRVGSRFGRARLRALLSRATKGKYLEVIMDDRRGEQV